MAVRVNILTAYSGAGTKKAIRDLGVMQRQASLAGNGAAAGMLKASAAVQRVGAGLSRTGSWLTKRVGIPIVALGIAATVMAGHFDSSMKLIQTQAGGSAKDVRVLSEEVLRLGAAAGTQHGPQELSAALYHLKSVGMDNKRAMDALTQSERLASVGHADLEATTNAVAGAYKSGIKGAQSFKMTVGTLNAVIGAGNLRMEDLNSALGTGFLVTAQTFGVSLTSMGAALAMMTSRGIPATRAATALKMTLSAIAAPSAVAEKAFAKINLNSKQLAETIRSKGLGAGLKEIKDHLKGLSKTEQSIQLTRMFGAKSSQAILTLLGNLKDYDRTQKQVAANSGKFDKLAAAEAQDAAAKWDHFKAAAASAGIQLGNVLLPYGVKLADKLGGIAQWLTKLSPGTRKWVLQLALAGAAIGPVLLIVGKLTTGVGKLIGVAGKLTLAFGKGSQAAPLWARAIAGTVKGIGSLAKSIAQGIAALGQQAVALAQDGAAWIANAARQAAAAAVTAALWVRDAAVKAASTAATIAASVASKAAAAAQWLLNAALSANPIGIVVVAIAALVAVFILAYKHSATFRAIVQATWTAIHTAITTVVNAVISIVRTWGPRLLAAVAPMAAVAVYVIRHWQQIKDGASSAFNAVVSFARGIPGRIKSALGNVGSLLTDAGRQIIMGLLSGITAAWHFVTDKLSGLIGGLSKAAKKLLGINSPSKVFAEIGKSIAEGLKVGITKGEAEVAKAAVKSAKNAVKQANAVVQSMNQRKQEIAGGVSLWTSLTPDTPPTKHELLSSMTGNRDAMAQWALDLHSLSTSLPKELVAQIASEGVGSASEVAALKSMSAQELAQWAGAWQDIQHIAAGEAKRELLPTATQGAIRDVTVKDGAVQVTVKVGGQTETVSAATLQAAVKKAVAEGIADLAREIRKKP